MIPVDQIKQVEIFLLARLLSGGKSEMALFGFGHRFYKAYQGYLRHGIFFLNENTILYLSY